MLRPITPSVALPVFCPGRLCLAAYLPQATIGFSPKLPWYVRLHLACRLTISLPFDIVYSASRIGSQLGTIG